MTVISIHIYVWYNYLACAVGYIGSRYNTNVCNQEEFCGQPRSTKDLLEAMPDLLHLVK